MTPRRAPDAYEGLHVSIKTRDVAADRPEFGGWYRHFVFDLTGYVDVDQAVFRVVSLTVGSNHPVRDISPTSLRELPLAEIIRRCKMLMVEQSQAFTPENLAAIYAENGWGVPPTDDPLGSQKRIRARIKAASRTATPQGASRGRGDAFYRRIALDLIELVESGKPTPGGVLETLAAIEAKRLKQNEVPVQTVRTWLRVARQKGYLAPGERGRLVALAGPNLYRGSA